MSMIVEAAVAIAKAIEAMLGGCSLSISFRLCLCLTGGKTNGNEAKSGDCLRRSYRIFALLIGVGSSLLTKDLTIVLSEEGSELKPRWSLSRFIPGRSPAGGEAKLTWARTSLGEEKNPPLVSCHCLQTVQITPGRDLDVCHSEKTVKQMQPNVTMHPIRQATHLKTHSSAEEPRISFRVTAFRLSLSCCQVSL